MQPVRAASIVSNRALSSVSASFSDARISLVAQVASVDEQLNDDDTLRRLRAIS